MHPATARLNGSLRGFFGRGGFRPASILWFLRRLRQGEISPFMSAPSGRPAGHSSRFRAVPCTKAALIKNSATAARSGPVAFLEKGQAESEADIAEPFRNVGPGDDDVRGLISQFGKRSPAINALRVRSATRTVLPIVSRPSLVAWNA